MIHLLGSDGDISEADTEIYTVVSLYKLYYI